jgi:hypothetical protein
MTESGVDPAGMRVRARACEECFMDGRGAFADSAAPHESLSPSRPCNLLYVLYSSGTADVTIQPITVAF